MFTHQDSALGTGCWLELYIPVLTTPCSNVGPFANAFGSNALPFLFGVVFYCKHMQSAATCVLSTTRLDDMLDMCCCDGHIGGQLGF